MKKYQFVFLTRSGLFKENLAKIFGPLEKEIKNINGKVSKKEDFGKQELAYAIEGKESASFWIWYLEFDTGPDLTPFNTYLNREKKIIRYLLLESRR
ncbi:MAG: 30S ribosomal protein S6 [Patescibacteria group bacterium]|nr:30S ribosomal protein S6 [Patescibacteria group bacterium]